VRREDFELLGAFIAEPVRNARRIGVPSSVRRIARN
jgi:hypothetical protein